jgi:nitrate reductase gamma subunit
MNEDKMQKEVVRVKKWNFVMFGVFAVIFAVIFVALIIMVCSYQYQHSYSQYKWNTDKVNRYKFVSDMLEQNQLVGMTEAEVVQLLGDEDSNDITSFKNSKGFYVPESTLVYWLGVDFMDDNWLVISIDDSVVTDYCIGLT